VPLPLRFTTLVVPVVELLVNVRLPDAAPTAPGSNWTWIERAMAGPSVTGKAAPENVKPAPDRVAALTVTGEVPAEVSVTGRVTGIPTGTSPKFKVAGLRARTALGELVPIPVRPTVVVPSPDELLAMVIVPIAEPVTVGSKLS
jgi:hypothetical protein